VRLHKAAVAKSAAKIVFPHLVILPLCVEAVQMGCSGIWLSMVERPGFTASALETWEKRQACGWSTIFQVTHKPDVSSVAKADIQGYNVCCVVVRSTRGQQG